jgi:predicted ArsR family transcriptional regulator
MPDWLPEQAAGISALVDPGRRALYQYVVAQPDPVSREQAAGALGMPVHSAKFHLDKLAEQGLLDVEFRRLTGRTGPGAGRPSKLYRRSARQFSISLPERRYDLAGDVLAEAIDVSLREGVPLGEAVSGAAARRGRRIAGSPDKDETSSLLTRAVDVLALYGYEPRDEDQEIRLTNCPFHRLAQEHTTLVCGMNLALIGGVLDELGVQGATPELSPQAGYCCVRIRTPHPAILQDSDAP